MEIGDIFERCKQIFEDERFTTKEIELFHKIYAFMHKKSLYNQINPDAKSWILYKLIPIPYMTAEKVYISI